MQSVDDRLRLIPAVEESLKENQSNILSCPFRKHITEISRAMVIEECSMSFCPYRMSGAPLG